MDNKSHYRKLYIIGDSMDFDEYGEPSEVFDSEGALLYIGELPWFLTCEEEEPNWEDY